MNRLELNTTVLESTRVSIEETASSLQISVGELIDRMALNWEAKDPVYAAQLILEDFIIHCHRLKTYETGEALRIVLSILKECMDDLTPENIKKATEEYFSRSTM